MTLKTDAYQIGNSLTATQNFSLEVPAVPDGTVKLVRGNAGAGTQDILSVDAAGAVSFTPSSQTGFKNIIINGRFGINQRAHVSGAATTAGQYTLDRWKVTGAGGITFSTTNNKTTVTIPSGQTLQQVIEGLNLQTGTYTLSWEGTAQGKIGAGSYGASGITGSITGGTDTTIEFGPGTVANVQLEAGSVATPFEHRPYGTELALCQRYYEKLELNEMFIFGVDASQATANIQYKTTKRSAATVAIISGSFTWWNGTAHVTLTGGYFSAGNVAGTSYWATGSGPGAGKVGTYGSGSITLGATSEL